ncbi:MAG TPA: hypothetical protein V6C82_09470 [Chroococcales cyanobacterium]
MKAKKLPLFLALLGCALSPPVLAQSIHVPREGDQMDYLLSNGDLACSRVVEVEEGDEQSVAKVVQEVTHADGKQQINRYSFIYTPSAVGIALPFPDAENAEAKVSPLICYLEKAGLEDAWMAQSGSFRFIEEGALASCRFSVIGQLEKIETVMVKAGTFKGCCRVGFRLRGENGKVSTRSKLTIWYLPELGIVKTHTERDGVQFESQLVFFKQAKM